MSDLVIRGRTVHPTTVEKFPITAGPGGPYSIDASLKYGEGHDVDNIFMTDGKDCYVAAKKNLIGTGVKDGDAVTLDGKALRVYRTHDRLDTIGGKIKGLVILGAMMLIVGLDRLMGRRNPF